MVVYDVIHVIGVIAVIDVIRVIGVIVVNDVIPVIVVIVVNDVIPVIVVIVVKDVIRVIHVIVVILITIIKSKTSSLFCPGLMSFTKIDPYLTNIDLIIVIYF